MKKLFRIVYYILIHVCKLQNPKIAMFTLLTSGVATIGARGGPAPPSLEKWGGQPNPEISDLPTF